MPATTVTREDLYRLASETPIIRLAAVYGISETDLKKICDRLEVSVPPRGYWAQKEAGQPPTARRSMLRSGATLQLSLPANSAGTHHSCWPFGASGFQRHEAFRLRIAVIRR